MATAKPQVSGLQDLPQCLICLNRLGDHRILRCGHFLCLVCLEGITGPSSLIKCPLCDKETQLGASKRLADLPEPILVHDLQQKIASLLGRSKNKTSRYCGPCDQKHVKAVNHCFQCWQSYCESCEAKHNEKEAFDGHKTEPITDLVFCEYHADDVITDFCLNCKIGICQQCTMGYHSEHKLDGILGLAKISRRRLEAFVKQGGLLLDETEVTEVKKQIPDAEERRRQFRNSVFHLRGLFKEFEKKLDKMEKKMETTFFTQIKYMKQYASDLNDVISSNVTLMDYTKLLLDHSPEPELVLWEQDFSNLADCSSLVPPCYYNLPDFEDTFSKLIAGANSLIKNCELTYQSRVLGKRFADAPEDTTPLTALGVTQSYSVGCKIDGLVADSSSHSLGVRTHNEFCPIQTYDYHSQFLEGLGGDIKGLVDVHHRGISMDTKRSLYMCPVEGAVVFLDRNGKLTASVKVGSQPVDISYSVEQDVYVVADVKACQVFVIDATSRQIVTGFGTPGSRAGQLKTPFNVHIGYVRGFSQLVIVISDFGNNRVQVHDMKGQHVHTFGIRGRGDGQLQQPWGVTTDPAGRIIVCDQGNRRVVAFWWENNEDQWRCLLGREQLGNKEPRCVSCDPLTRVMAVATLKGRIQMFR